MYDPQPADTSSIDLSDNIEVLVEKLAENRHDVWARKRMDDG